MTAMAYINVRPHIKVAGEERGDLRQALSSMVVNLPRSGMAHGELTLTNWLPDGESGGMDYGFQDLALGDEVELLMGADGDQSLFRGEITALEERYGEGAPQLVLLLQDKLHRLARRRHSRAFEDQSFDDIVAGIARDAGLESDVSFSSVNTSCHQLNESDLAFVMRLGNAFDVAVRLDGESLRVRPEEPDPEPLELHARDSVRKLRLIADLNHQPTKIEVRGFNPANGEDLSEQSDALSPPPEATTAADTLEQLGWPGEAIVPQPFPRSRGEAEAYARASYRRAARQFISGDLYLQGEPSLRGGREIDLAGVSPRLRGSYQIVHCAHRFDNNSGYETHLKVSKADWQP